VARHPDKPKYLYRIVRKNKRRAAAVYWRSAPPGLEPEMRKAEYLTQAIIDWANRRNRSAVPFAAAAPGTFQQLADIYRGVPIHGVTPSPKQKERDPVRYGAGQEISKPSQQWVDLAPRTRRDYTRYVDQIVSMWGAEPVSALEVEMVVDARDTRRSTPRVANFLLNVLSAMLAVALERKRSFGIDINVAANVARLGKKAGVKPRQVYWSYEDELRFIEDADRSDPIVCDGEFLLAYTGQRPSDCRKMMDTDYDGTKIRVVQSKTGARVWIHCHEKLKARLDRNIADARAAGLLHFPFIRGTRGQAIGERYFASRWDAIAGRTGTMHLNRQDLRRTAVIRLAEASCTVPEIASITGHSPQTVHQIMNTYLVTTYEMAKTAIEKLERYQREIEPELPA
jgi:integrase